MKRYIHKEGMFKVVVIDGTQIGRDLFSTLNCSPIALQLLTQATTGAFFLCADLKVDGVVSLKFEGPGPIGALRVEANTLGHVRGTADDLGVHFDPEPDRGLFQQAVGVGQLTVRRRLDKNDKVFTSVVPTSEGEIAYNLANYLLSSEQIPSAIRLGVVLDPEQGIAGAGGIMIQGMPGANHDMLFVLEQRLTEIADLGSCFSETDGHARVMDFLFEGIPLKHLANTEVRYFCGCSQERILEVVQSLSTRDLKELTEADQAIEIRCNYCHKPYEVGIDHLNRLLEERGKAS
ncbi:Hsp33 family molecular chaperone HslO [Sulfidibacter corallicola]|uniref:Hsp33 family molecular chaperone HslO n=1 Tax=Sulfidibacter corallicola TaxID=2818388 RepID=A0A8A4TVV4_SULCO|nr:Hsp33 family molecular chaperone HslO [Sulfidibacter corallicola]QTD53613.1 Hsp33 family molecular chaperone HslO [Sulfidibacter corallicola]